MTSVVFVSLLRLDYGYLFPNGCLEVDINHSFPEVSWTCVTKLRLLFVVEGTNDIEFLRRISLLLHADDETRDMLRESDPNDEIQSWLLAVKDLLVA